MQLIRLIGNSFTIMTGDKKCILRKSLRNKDGQSFTNLQKTPSKNFNFRKIYEHKMLDCLNIQPSALQNIINTFREYGKVSGG